MLMQLIQHWIQQLTCSGSIQTLFMLVTLLTVRFMIALPYWLNIELVVQERLAFFYLSSGENKVPFESAWYAEIDTLCNPQSAKMLACSIASASSKYCCEQNSYCWVCALLVLSFFECACMKIDAVLPFL
jgi:hypothetical protein